MRLVRLKKKNRRQQSRLLWLWLLFLSFFSRCGFFCCYGFVFTTRTRPIRTTTRRLCRHRHHYFLRRQEGWLLTTQQRPTTLRSPSASTSLLFSVVRNNSNNHNKEQEDEIEIESDEPADDNKLYNVNLLLIDHYDSFTYNLYDLLSQYTVNKPTVLAADANVEMADFYGRLKVVRRRTDKGGNSSSRIEGQEEDHVYDVDDNESYDVYDGVVLSPGPGHPNDNICQLAKTVIRKCPNLPILGVCLGHQILGDMYGANITLAPKPVHGQVWKIIQQSNENNEEDDAVWKGIWKDEAASTSCSSRSTIDVTRYHSLQIVIPDNSSDNNGSLLIPTSVSENDNVIMSMRHVHNPHYGVQFHPESIGTDQIIGPKLIQNFVQLCYNHKKKQQQQRTTNTTIIEKRKPEDPYASTVVIDEQESSSSLLSVMATATTTTGITAKNAYTTTNNDRSGSNNDSQKQKQQQESKKNRHHKEDVYSTTRAGSTRRRDYSVYIHKVSDLPPNGANFQPQDVMEQVLADNDFSFWLDDSSSQAGRSVDEDDDDDTSNKDDNNNAVSILGTSGNGRLVEYWGEEKAPEQRGLFVYDNNGNKNNDDDEQQPHQPERVDETDILTYLQKFHDGDDDDSSTSAAVNPVFMVQFQQGPKKDDVVTTTEVVCHEDDLMCKLPFQFRGGHVGYLGYEVRHDTARYLEQEENGQKERHRKASGRRRNASEQYQQQQQQQPSGKGDPQVPTAAFVWADQSFVYDHRTCEWYLVGVARMDDKGEKDRVLEWMQSMAHWLQTGQKRTQKNRSTMREMSSSSFFTPNRSRETYNRNFDQCQEHIWKGESYELCLTNQLEATIPQSDDEGCRSPLDLYCILRRRNAAPFSAFFNWNSKQGRQKMGASVAICCSSPERFVSVRRKRRSKQHGDEALQLEVEAKPIKGTIARVVPSDGRTSLTHEEQQLDSERAEQLRCSVKDRAENLMIVDLLRNDLNRVCQTGTVHVAKLMDIESFATVHQMVSTIRGTLDHSRSGGAGGGAVRVLKACFPGGSMTGAPKLRTMELLDDIEEGVCRGPYSGCLGYISLNGSMDMNIVIRSAILTPSSLHKGGKCWKARIGAGGAITALSDNSDEYNEMMIKASAVMGAVNEWAGASDVEMATTGTNDAVDAHYSPSSD